MLRKCSVTTISPQKRFDAIEILYSNQANNPTGTFQGAIGWLDETLFDEKGRLRRKEELCFHPYF